MKALVGAFNQEKALVGAFSLIVQPVVEPMDQFAALHRTAAAAAAAVSTRGATTFQISQHVPTSRQLVSSVLSSGLQF